MGRELYERLDDDGGPCGAGGRGAEARGAAYDDFVGSLDARVLVSARRFRELGVSASRNCPTWCRRFNWRSANRAPPSFESPTQESLLVEAEIVTEATSPPSLTGSTPNFGETGR